MRLILHDSLELCAVKDYSDRAHRSVVEIDSSDQAGRIVKQEAAGAYSTW
jgi:hypothetical protein